MPVILNHIPDWRSRIDNSEYVTHNFSVLLFFGAYVLSLSYWIQCGNRSSK